MSASRNDFLIYLSYSGHLSWQLRGAGGLLICMVHTAAQCSQMTRGCQEHLQVPVSCAMQASALAHISFLPSILPWGGAVSRTP